jgi:RHS repeat-associated protein
MLQDLGYTYDPVGNITHIHDDAQQTIYFNNQVVTPHADYTYDAIYRLLTAEGREHIGQVSQPETTWDDAFRVKLQHPQDGQAMRRYTERYDYDPVGNFLQLIHQAANGNWTRCYTYNESSLIEPGKQSNRLSSTVVGSGSPEAYPYDAHGNMTAMPHLPGMDWDFHDQLQHVALAGGGDAYYVYDATGQRVRKVIEKNSGALIEERLYLGGFEIFRRRNGSGTVMLERETLHIMDDQQRIALVETRTQGSEPGVPAQLVRYQYGNHLGSAALELDAQAQVISYEEYYPYGSTSYQAGRSAAEVSLKRYRNIGKERDEETGFAYYGFRYYVRELGRWISTDPASLKDGLNLYCFTRANPVTLVDAVGTDSKSSTQGSTTLIQHFENVVERRNNEGSVQSIQLGGGDIEKRLVSGLMTLGASTFMTCSKNDSAEEYFDRGAIIFAATLHLEREYGDAVSRGVSARNAADRRQLYAFDDWQFPMPMTREQHDAINDARINNRNLLPKITGDLIASFGSPEMNARGNGRGLPDVREYKQGAPLEPVGGRTPVEPVGARTPVGGRGTRDVTSPGGEGLPTGQVSKWKMSRNAFGAEVYRSTTPTMVSAAHIEGLVQYGVAKGGPVRLYSGFHLGPNGDFKSDRSLFLRDNTRYGQLPNVTVIDASSLHPATIDAMVEAIGEGVVIVNSCYSCALK